jgi:hypothetical protein
VSPAAVTAAARVVSLDIPDIERLASGGGPLTGPSGAAGLAGLLSALPGSPRGADLGVDETSRILLIVTEGRAPDQLT